MLNVSNIKINYKELLARLGYLQAKTKLDDKTSGLIKEILDLAQKLIKPKVVIAFENIIITENFVSFKNSYKIKSNNVAVLLRNCFKAYGVSVTIGSALESKRDEFLKKKEIFNALILDAAGSVAAEEAITLANAQIKGYEEKNGNILTKRYSPGYGDWELESNKDFLDWIGADSIGIKLNGFCQMKPEKSVSALIGVKNGLPFSQV
ncbi:MAG: hypothetical protein LBT18_02060 [Endomicrobium sp.]|jgi:hypothetical protein|nr:hypothetical protein [Endomicrobium sp.]